MEPNNSLSKQSVQEVVYLKKQQDFNLEEASYLTIKLYEKKSSEPPSGMYFNKILSLTHHQFKDEGVDFGLPHSWYRYGDEVVRQCMPKQLNWNHETPTRTKVMWDGNEPDLGEGSLSDRIKEKIENLTNTYHNNFWPMVQADYSFAPFKFQRDFLNTREILYGMQNAFNFDLKTSVQLSKPTLKKTFKNFPIMDFPDLREEYDIIMHLQEIVLSEEEPDLLTFQESTVAFWFLFCYYMRAHDKAHENIPTHTVNYWRSRIPFEKEKYRSYLADLVLKYSEYDERVEEDEVLRSEMEWRKKDLKETDELIEEMIDDLQGLKEFSCNYNRKN